MSDEAQALIRKARKSIQAAKLLMVEGLHDIAIARAYYAMFYLAKTLLLEKGLTFSKHKSTISAFGQHLVKTSEVDAKFH